MISDKDITLYETYIEDPGFYIEQVLGAERIERYQDKILKAVHEFDFLAIKATHSVGKTWLMARVGLWFFNIFQNSIVITTAPTHRQVKTLLWGEIRDAYKKAKVNIGGRLLDTELKISDKHYMLGFSPEKKADTGSGEQIGSSFQGFHSSYILIMFDEATGVPADVWIMAQGLMTSGKIVKFVAIGNPTTRNSKFFEFCNDPAWKVINISCFDSPNMIANGLNNKADLKEEIDRLSCLNDIDRIKAIKEYKKPVHYLLTAQFVVPYVMKHGFDHPLVLSKVFGEFPLNDDEVLVQYEDVYAAQQRDLALDPTSTRYIGVDVARGGGDKTVITEIQGFKQTSMDVYNKRDLMFISGLVIQKINEESGRDTVVTVDATGLGSGVLDKLLEAQRDGFIDHRVMIVEIHFGSTVMNVGADKPGASEALKNQEKKDKKVYSKVKAKIFDLLAADLRGRLDILSESVYLEELPTIKYSLDGNGRIVIESKKDYKARTKKSSPDSSDSLALANFGRYISMGAGHFFKKQTNTPIVKTQNKKPRQSRIKVREY